jgi:hypothetical protein
MSSFYYRRGAASHGIRTQSALGDSGLGLRCSPGIPGPHCGRVFVQPQRGCIPKPRVAQRTLGTRSRMIRTATRCNSSGAIVRIDFNNRRIRGWMVPRGTALRCGLPRDSDPECARRLWALDLDRVAVGKPRLPNLGCAARP